MEKYFLFMFFGGIAVFVITLISEIVSRTSDGTNITVPVSLEEQEEHDRLFGYSYDYDNINNVGHGIAMDD